MIGNEKMWDGELAKLDGFTDEVIKDLALIREKGMYEALRQVISQ